MFHENRTKKREREEDDASLPISKRINRLHIRNSVGQNPETESINNNNVDFIRNQNDIHANNTFGHPSTVQNNPSQMPAQQPSTSAMPQQFTPQSNDNMRDVCRASFYDQNTVNPQHVEMSLPNVEPYDPELNKMLNPHYYDLNKRLYFAHMTKLHRINNQNENDIG